MGYYSSHEWSNGAVTTVERMDGGEISIRVQAEGEKMLTDIVIGDFEALCLAQSILSVLAYQPDREEVES